MGSKPRELRRFENIMDLGFCDGKDCSCAHRCKFLSKSKWDALEPPMRRPYLAVEVESDESIVVLCLTFKHGNLRPVAGKAKTKKR